MNQEYGLELKNIWLFGDGQLYANESFSLFTTDDGLYHRIILCDFSECGQYIGYKHSLKYAYNEVKLLSYLQSLDPSLKVYADNNLIARQLVDNHIIDVQGLIKLLKVDI